MLSSSSGLTKDQKNPRTDPRYRAFRSRATRLWMRPRWRSRLARLRHIDGQHRDGDVIRPAGLVRRIHEGAARLVERRGAVENRFQLLRQDDARQAVRANHEPIAWLDRERLDVHVEILAAGERA